VPWKTTEFGEFLQFETLTLCPIDKRPIITSMLTNEERQWLDNYHQNVYERLAPHLAPHEAAWLQQACVSLEE
jgi:Xaa-Pro aminopeptidase